ncbi:MAG: 50S ribosomal protein L30 [Spirochaetales bacterium]|nr:50S ribosomal protein L30 [Spirochaetales bacterium]
MAKQVKITLVKSLAHSLPAQRGTAKALGLGKISSSVIKEQNPSTEGMIKVIAHLVKVEEI